MSICGTTIEYNRNVLTDVLTESWDCSTVFDTTGVDPIGIKWVITCVCELHTSNQTLHGYNINSQAGLGVDLGPNLKDTIESLLIPRRRFKMWIGNTLVFAVWPGAVGECENENVAPDDDHMDVALGPRANVQILSIAGKNAAKCRCRFEFTLPIPCDGYIGDILNLRYWMADDVDCKDWTTTRKWVGRIRLKRHTTDAAANPFALARTLTLPPIQKGFHRKSIGWSESSDGLNFDFTIVDQEVWAVAPPPATDWEGSYTLTVPPGAVCTEQELSFKLWTHRATDEQWEGKEKSMLFQLAQRIIEKKIQWERLNVVGAGKRGSIYVLSSVWSEDLKRAEVSVSVRIRNTNPMSWFMNLHQTGNVFSLGHPLSGWFAGAQGSGSGFVDYDKDKAYIPPKVPTTMAGLLICALQNPCCTEELNKTGDTPTVYEDPPTYVSQTSPGDYPDTERHSPAYSDSHQGTPGIGMYHWYKMESDYFGDTGWRAFPLGAQCNPQSNYDTVAFAQLHCQVMFREVRIHACRTNAWPQLPSPEHWTDRNGIKHVLIDFKLSPCPIALSADGQDKACEVSATYRYALSRPPKLTELANPSQANNEMLLAGVLPLVDASVLGANTNTTDFTAVSPEYFKEPHWILDDGNQTPGSDMGA